MPRHGGRVINPVLYVVRCGGKGRAGERKRQNTACKTYEVYTAENETSNIEASGTPGHLFHLRPHRSYMRLSREEGVESKSADRRLPRAPARRFDHRKAEKGNPLFDLPITKGQARGPLVLYCLKQYGDADPLLRTDARKNRTRRMPFQDGWLCSPLAPNVFELPVRVHRL